jgi:hypothetical protein
MVSTRRGAANAESATSGTKRSNPIQSSNDTIDVIQHTNKKATRTPVTPKVVGAVLKATLSGNISDHDLSLTSPITGDNPAVAINTPRRQQGSPNLPERTVSSALRRLAPKPFGNMSGSSHNPIVVNENSSPSRPAVRAPKRKHRHQKLPEPHKFIEEGYRDLYNYRVAKSPLSALPANGTTFTGHQSHDIYRMMNVKMVAAPGFSPNAAWGRDSRNVPFQVQYPISAQYLAQQQQQQQRRSPQPSPQPSPYAQYYQYQAPPNAYPMVPSQNEDMLRKKAVQYIREVSRPTPRKRRLSDADPDQTSVDEAETPKAVVRTPASKTTPQSALMSLWGHYYTDNPHIPQVGQFSQIPQIPQVPRIPQKKAKPVVYQDPDPQSDLNNLIEHTSLITSLLQTYPYSKDQKGLREDISMMVNVQNRHMTEWMKSESQSARKRRKIEDENAARVNQAKTAATTAVRVQKEQDSALRNVFSANADMWQDGTGHGVADVFAAEPASSPVASFTGSVPSQSIEAAGPVGDAASPYVGPGSTELEVASRESKSSSPGSKHASPNEESTIIKSASASPTTKAKRPAGKSVHERNETSDPVNKPAPPEGGIASPTIAQGLQPDSRPCALIIDLPSPVSKSSGSKEELPTIEKSPQPNNKLQPSKPARLRPHPRNPSYSRTNKLYISSNKVPSSRDITPTPTPTPSSSCLNSESSYAGTLHRPVFRFERKVPAAAEKPSLQRQETTESMKRVDAEYRVLTKEYLEAQGLEVKKGK